MLKGMRKLGDIKGVKGKGDLEVDVEVRIFS